MGTIRYLVAASMPVCLIAARSEAQDNKEPTTADKLVGTWVVTKVPKCLGQIEKGMTLEFKKVGACRVEFKPGDGVDGTYAVDGETVTVTDQAGKMTLKIKSLTGDRLTFGGTGTETLECEKKKALLAERDSRFSLIFEGLTSKAMPEGRKLPIFQGLPA